ncbi:hypothetical protein [Streptomyces sp. CA-111067]|uniref:hypothetical protein n=1 Tax=Streptomyces sp. CA-111067 TaxID=3240046 RepID=UPI003D951401
MQPQASGNILYLIDFPDLSGTTAGWVEWSQDPSGGDPGDSMRVTDSWADGYGVEADLDISSSNFRIATTAGHNSPYTSKWASGNLPERHKYNMDIWMVKGGQHTWVDSITVTS